MREGRVYGAVAGVQPALPLSLTARASLSRPFFGQLGDALEGAPSHAIDEILADDGLHKAIRHWPMGLEHVVDLDDDAWASGTWLDGPRHAHAAGDAADVLELDPPPL